MFRFVTDKKRSEHALISMIQEAYINGVSNRKVEKLAKTLGIESLAASQVSDINLGNQDCPLRNRNLRKNRMR